jgi:acyl transferase domain-containing protein
MVPERKYHLMACSIAGIPMDQLRGTNTSVYSGIMFRDYHDTQVRDPSTLPRYFLLGNAASMASNRVSHFFDLHGPSMSVDTACSSTLTALHLACQSLRKGESGISIVTGSSLMLNADVFIGMSNIGSALSTPPKRLHRHVLITIWA